MATREQVFTVLAAASGPMSRAQLEEGVGESYRKFVTQMQRWEKQGLIEDKGDHHYVLTDKGREAALEGEFDMAEHSAGGSGDGPPEHSDESLATTEYQQFLKLGKQTGVVPLPLIKQTADHVWSGGDFRDLRWVAVALQQMGIRQDLRSRWFHSWRSYLRQPLPTELPQEFFPPAGGGERKEGEKREGTGKRDYILSSDNAPVYVGEYQGDLDYKDALDLAKVRMARSRGDSAATTPGSMADEVTKIFTAFKAVTGERVEGRSYVVKPGPEGYEVEEVDPSRPVLIPQAPGAKQGPSYFVDSDGAVKELAPGQPVVIMKDTPRPPATTGTHYLIDQRTGEVKEVAPGQPVVIIRESSPPAQSTPIQFTDKDGKPMILDLSTFIRLEEHRDKQRRDEDSHQTKMEIAKGFKDLLHIAQRAASHLGEEEE